MSFGGGIALARYNIGGQTGRQRPVEELDHRRKSALHGRADPRVLLAVASRAAPTVVLIPVRSQDGVCLYNALVIHLLDDVMHRLEQRVAAGLQEHDWAAGALDHVLAARGPHSAGVHATARREDPRRRQPHCCPTAEAEADDAEVHAAVATHGANMRESAGHVVDINRVIKRVALHEGRNEVARGVGYTDK
jgi:hypothetical protein